VTATIWRTCPSCGGGFEQPDDLGRTRVCCSRACQQAAYRTRQRSSAGHRHRSDRQRTGRQDRPQDWRSERHKQCRQRAGSGRSGATTSARISTPAARTSTDRRQEAPTASGPAPEGDDLARIRRFIAAPLRKAAASFPHEAAACWAKVEALRTKYGL
jgi:hypothetical protein